MHFRIALIVVGVIALTVAVASVLRVPELSRRIACQQNMKHIAMAVKVYGMPDGQDAAALLRFGESAGMAPEEMICPSSGLDKCNYVIVPHSLVTKQGVDNRLVVMYEPKSNHGDGGNIFFADGHATFARGALYDRYVRNPTRWWDDEGKQP